MEYASSVLQQQQQAMTLSPLFEKIVALREHGYVGLYQVVHCPHEARMQLCSPDQASSLCPLAIAS